jgi:ubiquitin-protein ligase
VNARLRVIVISDGEDWGSRATPVGVLNQLLEIGAVVDAVVVSTTDDNDRLGALCEMTGGIVFRSPEGLEDGKAIFEQEAFLNLAIRKSRQPAPRPVTQADFDATFNAWVQAKRYAATAENAALAEARMPTPLATPLCAVWNAQKKAGLCYRTRRILREIKYMVNHMTIDIPIWVDSANPEKIRAFIKAPPESPYGAVFFSVYITFPARYPTRPPIVRFTGIPYHPNISAEGKVLFSLVDANYRNTLTVCEILEGLRNLLSVPEYAGALNSTIGTEYETNKASCNVHAATVDEFDVAPRGKYVDVPADACPELDRDDTEESLHSVTHSRLMPTTIPQPDDDLNFSTFG